MRLESSRCRPAFTAAAACREVVATEGEEGEGIGLVGGIAVLVDGEREGGRELMSGGIR